MLCVAAQRLLMTPQCTAGVARGACPDQWPLTLQAGCVCTACVFGALQSVRVPLVWPSCCIAQARCWSPSPQGYLLRSLPMLSAPHLDYAAVFSVLALPPLRPWSPVCL